MNKAKVEKMDDPVADEMLVQDYLIRISNALKHFYSSAIDSADSTDVDMEISPQDSHISAEFLARQLLKASDISLLSKPVNSRLPAIPIIQRICDLPEEQDEEEERLLIPYKRRRVDYLRDILRAMAPLQLDVAANVCTMLMQQSSSTERGDQEESIEPLHAASAWVLFSVWLPVAPQIVPIASHLFSQSCYSCPLKIFPGDEAIQFLLAEATHRVCEFYASKMMDYPTLISFWNWSDVFQWLSRLRLSANDAMDVDDDTYRYFPEFTFHEAALWHILRSITYTLNLRAHKRSDYIRQFGPTMYAERVPWVMHPFTTSREELTTQRLAWNGKGLIQWLIQGDNNGVFDMPNASQVRRFWPIHPFLVDCGEGISLVRSNLHDKYVPEKHHLVRTPTTAQNLVAIASVMCMSPYPPPVLVCGPAGAGKSSIVRELARIVAGRSGSDRHDDYLLEIHVDEETDTKTLVGCYTTTEIPGQFAWRPGALTVAVREGKWVLLEDIDTIPRDIQAALVKLLQDRLLPLGNGKVERCHPNFRIFATLTTSAQSTSSGIDNRKVFHEHLWMKVEAKPLPFAELKDIALGAHADLPEFIADTILKVFRSLDQSGRDDDEEGECRRETSRSFSDELKFDRPSSVRDLLKVMSRVSGSVIFEKHSSYATENQRLLCLAETTDVFAGSCPNPKQRRDFIQHYAAPAWGLSNELAIRYIESRTPEMQQRDHMVRIGRACLDAVEQGLLDTDVGTYACTGYTLRMMESIAVCIRQNEPVLLVGETGGGKTSILQQLALISGHELVVQNLSLQTDSTDILGGFRPLELRHVARRVYQEFVDLFTSTFSRKQNESFLNFASSCLKKKQWNKLSQCYVRASKMGLNKVQARCTEDSSEEASLCQWKDFVQRAELFENQRKACDTGLAFVFSEGILVEAIRKGHWILLDECNLASSETLQRLCGLLDDSSSSITLTERGDSVAIERHPNFRLFAAMNPATDAGKKDLPASIRARFTEFHVHEILDPIELRLITGRYLSPTLPSSTTSPESTEIVGKAVDVYLKSRHLAERVLVDGSGHKPRYSLRSLTRALRATKTFVEEQKMNLRRALVEGFETTFQGSLDEKSTVELLSLLGKHLANGLTPKERDQPGRNPGGRSRGNDFVLVQPFWIQRGPNECVDWSKPGDNNLSTFILTPTVRKNLRRLARAIASGPWPILLEGPTSAGKTTLVEFIAALCGHKVVRINNHEHTDIQEYTGGFASDDSGKLSFKDGLLVQALRNGNWVILDELNLAPTEVLEALNRLLDDNRELYLSEINEVVKPHPSFRLFATQNPSGAYGGRKPLSRAFRNRFLEMYVGDIPPVELVTILEERTGLAPSHAKILVATMRALRQRRNSSNVFMGQDSFMTPRDLLRWAQRQQGATSKVELAYEGYMLLAERLRDEEEKNHVRQELELQFKTSLDTKALYFGPSSDAHQEIAKLSNNYIAPTKSLLRLLTLVLRCMQRREPVLLVGETGCGKTTVVQLVSQLRNIPLNIVNCHATTETSDLLGGLRPVRGRSGLAKKMLLLMRELLSVVDTGDIEQTYKLPEFLKASENGAALPDNAVKEIIKLARALGSTEKGADGIIGRHQKRQKVSSSPNDQVFSDEEPSNKIGNTVGEIEALYKKHESLFEWSDGPLVQSMRSGCMILLDEMSLAEDAVLERLNSVLEPGRTLVLAEKGVSDGEDSKIVAHDQFHLFATMNPGGDFGKRELSPALRSRFTEIWIPPVSDLSDIDLVLKQTLGCSHLNSENANEVGKCILHYIDWFNDRICGDVSGPFGEFSLSLRDLLAWAQFVEAIVKRNPHFSLPDALYHGACLTHLDGLGLGTALSSSDADSVKRQATEFLKSLSLGVGDDTILKPFGTLKLTVEGGLFGIEPFTIPLGNLPNAGTSFNFGAPTTSVNLARILRGMQLSKPILLEGSPGVGKTTLIAALAAASGHHLVRINLSEQTDITDLLGSDMPVPSDDGDEAGSAFKWIDGVLLSAIKDGSWVLLDELNLASQTVLEGLNSILDHRASVYIPEIGETIACPPSFRVFAAQNPLGQGGGRKGLPKSFLNRFTKVYVESLTCEDQDLIISSKFPNIPRNLTSKMIAFNNKVHEDIVDLSLYAQQGSPWEFNLRDIFRWCELVSSGEGNEESVLKYAWDLYIERLRSMDDRKQMMSCISSIFGSQVAAEPQSGMKVSDTMVSVDDVTIQRIESSSHLGTDLQMTGMSSFLSFIKPTRAIARCIKERWPALLVGPSNLVKERTIASLAALCNAVLVEIDLTPSSDVSELLGSFEQSDMNVHDLERAKRLCELATVMYIRNQLDVSSPSTFLLFSLFQDIHGRKNDHLSMHSLAMKISISLREYSTTIDDPQMEKLLQFHSKDNPRKDAGSRKGRFEWKDGALVQAMQKGEWIHLRNANLCPSSVLDRLNSVLEPDGYLLLLEGAAGEGSSRRVVKCHPNFRVFMTMDSDHGEVSRAMRNRCVEISFTEDKINPATVVDRLDAASQNGLHYMEDANATAEGRTLVVTQRLGSFCSSGIFRGTAPELLVYPEEGHNREVDSSKIIALPPTMPLNMLEWPKNPLWVGALWSGRFLQLFCAQQEEALSSELLSNISLLLPSSLNIEELDEKYCQALSLHFLIRFLWRADVHKTRVDFFEGFDHSLSRNATFLVKLIIDDARNNHSLSAERLYQFLTEEVWARQEVLDESLSVLRASQLVKSGKINSGQMNCQVTPLIAVLFEKFKTWWDSLQATSQVPNPEREALMATVVQRRDQLWRVTQQIPFLGRRTEGTAFGFDFHEFVVQWIWLKKAIHEAEPFLIASNPLHDLLSIVSSIDRFVFSGFQDLQSLSSLKWPEKPLVPRQANVWSTWLSMKELCQVLASLQTLEADDFETSESLVTLASLASEADLSIVVTKELKEECLAASAMFYLAVSSGATEKSLDFFLNQGSQIVKVMAKKTSWVQNQFREDFQSIKFQVNENGYGLFQEQSEVELSPLKMQNDTQFASFTRTLMTRFADVQLGPLSESICDELDGNLIRFICRKMIRGELHERSETQIKRAMALVTRLGQSSALMTVSDFGPHKALLWALEEKEWDEVRHPTFVKELIMSMVGRTCSRTWTNPYLSLKKISMELEIPQELMAPDGEDLLSEQRGAFGPESESASIDMKTSTVILMLSSNVLARRPSNCAKSFFTMENIESRKTQARSMVDLLNFPQIFEEQPFPWESLYLLKNLIEAMKHLIPEEHCSKLLDLCENPSLLNKESNELFVSLLAPSAGRTLKNLLASVVEPLLGYIEASWANRELASQRKDNAMVDIYLGLLRFHLSLPTSIIDPGRKPVAKMSLFKRQKELLQIQLTADVLYGISNSGTAVEDENLQNRIKCLDTKMAVQESRIISRGDTSVPFAQLYREFHDFARGFLDAEKISSLAQLLYGGEDLIASSQKAHSLVRSWAAFSKRCNLTYQCFEDILLPLTSSLSLVGRGLKSLLEDSLEGDETHGLSSSMSSGFSFPQNLRQPSVALDTLPSQPTKELWQCCLPMAFGELYKVALLGALGSVDRGIMKRWSRALNFILSRAEHGAVGQTTIDPESTDESVAEERFRAQFPDHRSAFVDGDPQSTDVVPNEATESPLYSPLLTNQDCEYIAWIHSKLFGKTQIESVDYIKAFHFGYQASSRMFQAGLFHHMEINPEMFTPGHILALSLNTPDCRFRSTGLNVEMIPGDFEENFHVYPDQEEALKASGPLERLVAKVVQLLSLFPGNAVLSSVFRVADRVRKLDALHTSPGKLMAGLEEILKHSEDWERHASKHVKIGEALIEIRQLVADLRKLELQSWPRLLLSREKEFDRRARRHWIRLKLVFGEFLSSVAREKAENGFKVDHIKHSNWIPKWVGKGLAFPSELILSDEPLSSILRDLLISLDTFILTSPIAEVLTRIDMLRAFGSQFAVESQLSRSKLKALLARTLKSVCYFYDQFTDHIQNAKLSLRKPFEERLRNEVKLAKWDQQSYYALVDTTERNYRKLMKILNDYDDSLQQITSQILEKEQLQGIKSNGDESSGSTEVPTNALMFPHNYEQSTGGIASYMDEGISPGWQMATNSVADNKRIASIPRYAARMSGFLKKNVTTSATRGKESASDFCESIFDRLESLRGKASTRPMKERALVDLFKELKRNGLSPMRWAVPEDFRNFGEILLLPLNLDMQKNGKYETRTSCEGYFLRTLVELNRLRPEIAANGGQYMTQRQANMMLGYAEHCAFVLSQQRTAFSSINEKLGKLESIQGLLALGTTRLLPHQIADTKSLQALRDSVLSAADSVRQLVLFLEASSHLLSNEGQAWSLDLARWLSDWVDGLNPAFLPEEAEILFTKANMEQIEKIEVVLSQAHQKLSDSRRSCISTGFIPVSCLDHCLTEIGKTLHIANHCTHKPAVDSNQSTFDSSLCNEYESLCTRAIETILLVAQTSTVQLNNEDDSESIWDCHKKATAHLLKVDLDKVTYQCHELTKALQQMSSSGRTHQETLDRCCALSADFSIFLSRLIKLIQQQVEQYQHFYRSCGKLTYTLIRVFRTLVAQGFCSDNVEEQEGSGDGEGARTFEDDKDGTGMGEGEGKKDVTDEIEDEEQLLGLKGDDKDEDGEKQQDQASKELDKEEAEKGMEMENDFDGEMYDVPEDAEQEEDDRSKEDDEEELDREMGDDAGPHEQVVDEKMWDESDDEESPKDQEPEQFEEDNPAKGAEKSDEMTTRDSQEDSAEKDENAGANEAQSNEQDSQDAPLGQEMQDELVNNEDDEMREENHGLDVRNENGDEGQEEEQEQDEDAMLLDDDIEMKDDESGDDAHSLEGDDPGEEAHLSDQEQPEAEVDDELEEEQDESSPQAEAAAQLDGNAHDDVDEENPDENDNPDQPLDAPSRPDPENAGLGVSAADGKDAVEDEAEENFDEGQTGGENTEESPDQNQESAGQGSSGSGSQKGSSISHGGQSDAQTRVSEKIPNPFQNLGDSEKFWHQKLNIVQADDSQEDGAFTNDHDEQPPEENQHPKGDYEYTNNNDKGTTQALGDLNEDTEAEKIDKTQELDRSMDASSDEKSNPNIQKPFEQQGRQSKSQSKPDQVASNEMSDEMADEEEEEDTPEDISETAVDQDPSSTDHQEAPNGDLDPVGSRVVSDLSQLNVRDEANDQAMKEDESIAQDESALRISEEAYQAARERWKYIHQDTYALARRLCEKLRLVMEPLVASKLKGDYRTGKRINMKRVIGYIASSYRKDKIWLRRTKPAKRDYRVLVAVDDSESMKKNGMGEMALRAMATLATGMSQLEVGEVGIASFGDEMRLVHPFEKPFTYESGVSVTSNFQFDQQRTRTALCVESAMMALEESSGGDTSSMQIVFMISDGRIERDSRSALRRLIREMMERNILLAMIIVEGSEKAKDSILKMKEVSFVNGKPKVKHFIEDYPFPYYIVLDDMTNLPSILGDALRQWFEMLTRLQTSNR